MARVRRRRRGPTRRPRNQARRGATRRSARCLRGRLDVAELGHQVSRDRLRGGAGADTLLGGEGDDVILANFGRDVSDGGPGDDRLYALALRDVTGPRDLAGDVVRGGIGDDRLFTRDDELDVVSCRAGLDVARLDAADVIKGATAAAPDGDCERVRRA